MGGVENGLRPVSERARGLKNPWIVIRGSENPWIVIRDSGIEKAAGKLFHTMEKLN